MTWTDPVTHAVGDFIDAVDWNAEITGNMTALIPANYKEFTSTVACTATTEGTANTIVASDSVTFNGDTIEVHFYAPTVSIPNGGSGTIILLEDSTVKGIIANYSSNSASSGPEGAACYAVRRLTPSAGAHTYTVKGFVSSGTMNVGANVGGSGSVYVPGFIQIKYVPG
jgi:hypothetical protein